MQLKKKPIPHDIPGMPRETVGSDIYMLNNKSYLSPLDYHNKFPVMMLAGLSSDSLIKKCKLIFTEYGFPRRIMCNTLTNFVSEKFWGFCKHLNIQQAMSIII